MSNEYFQPGAVPAPNSPGASAVIRNEFASIAAAFDKLPALAGNAGDLISVDPTGTHLISGGFNVNEIVTLTGVQTLTNKTISWADNTFPGFGTAATKDAGTGADEVLLLAVSGALPALDAGNLTNIPGLSLKADANNAVLTGAPVAPTPSTGDNSPRIATTQFVQDAVIATGSFAPSNTTPLMDGVAAPGTSGLGSRGDHVHPSDTSKAPLSAGTAVGTSFTPTGGVAASNVQAAIVELDSEKISLGSLTATNTTFTPTGGVAATNVQAAIAQLDTEKASLASPVFTGDPRAPTTATSDNDTSIATTAFVQTLLAQQPVGMQPSNSNPVMNGVVAPGTGVEGSRHDHSHPVDTSRAPTSAGTAIGTTFTPAGGIAATNVQAAIQELDTEKAPISGVVPTGTIIDFGGAVAPAGWLVCDGTLVSRTTYAALFSAIGVLWGAGDGSTTFALPNFATGKAAIAKGTTGTIGQSVAGNAIAHTHAVFGGSSAVGSGTLGAALQSGNPNVLVTIQQTPVGSSENFAAGMTVLKCIKT